MLKHCRYWIIFPLCLTFAYEIIDVLLLDIWRS